MQFTYGVPHWNYYTLVINDNDTVFLDNSEYSNKNSQCAVKSIVNFLEDKDLNVNNFPGLEDYLKENYPGVLSKSEPTEVNYKKLLEDLIDDMDCYHPDYDVHPTCYPSYALAKKALE